MIVRSEKKCKGTGRAKNNGCGKLTLFRKYGLCMDCYKHWLLNTPEGNKTIKKQTLWASRRQIRADAKKRKQEKEKNKSIQQLIQEARVPFQKWIRMRDANLKCISCGKDSETWDAGHFYKAEVFTGLIFNEVNVNKQCKYCNKYLDGNEAQYRTGLVRKYGSHIVDQLDSVVDSMRYRKFTREELTEIKNKYKQKLKLIE